MWELIRPAILIVARAGLFLSVTGLAWCGSEDFKPVTFGRDSGQNSVGAILSSRSWAIGVSVGEIVPVLWKIDFLLSPDCGVGGADRMDTSHGITFSQTSGTIIVIVDHWLIVTLFTALNILMYMIYRQRPEIQPCES